MEGWSSQVEGTGLENRQGVKALVGSNPTPSVFFQPPAAGAYQIGDVQTRP